MTMPQQDPQYDALKAQLLATATERFSALGLGLPDSHPNTRYPDGVWSDPKAAAVAGHKLLIHGDVGTGKTSLLIKATWRLCLERMRPVGGPIPLMLHRMKSKGSDDYIDWLLKGDFLVLDDLDKMGGTRYEGEKFLLVINHYDAYRKPIISTLNLPLPEFRERIAGNGVPKDYADAIYSRLIHRSITYHTLGHSDHRVEA